MLFALFIYARVSFAMCVCVCGLACVHFFDIYCLFHVLHRKRKESCRQYVYSQILKFSLVLSFSQRQSHSILFFFPFPFSFTLSPPSFLFMCMFGPCVYRSFSTYRIWPFVLLMPSHISVCNIIYVGLLASCLCSPSISVACLVRLFAQYLGLLYVQDCHRMNPVHR